MMLVSVIIAAIVITVALYIVKRDSKCDHGVPTTFRSGLSGYFQVPPVHTQATGTATLKLDNVSKTFTLTVKYEGIVPTAAHIHRGAKGENGPVVVPLIVGPSPMIYMSAPLTSAEIADLKNGLYYVNLHTTDFPDGEIRGQLIQV
jgi:hypothetical protein